MMIIFLYQLSVGLAPLNPDYTQSGLQIVVVYYERKAKVFRDEQE